MREEKGLPRLVKHDELSEAAAREAESIQKKGRVLASDFETLKAGLKCPWTALGELYGAQKNVKDVAQATVNKWRKDPEDAAVYLAEKLNAVGACCTVLRKSGETYFYVLLAAIAK